MFTYIIKVKLMNYKVNYKSINLFKIGRKTFHIGIFLLPSAFFFFCSIIINLYIIEVVLNIKISLNKNGIILFLQLRF